MFTVDAPGNIFKFSFSPDGKLLAGGDHVSHSVRLWDPATGKQVHRFPKTGICVDRPAFGRDGALVAAATVDTRRVTVWDVRSGNEVASWADDAPLSAIGMSPDGRLVATGREDGMVCLWDISEPGVAKRRWEGHAGAVSRLVFTPDGKAIVSSGPDGTIRVWNPAQPRAVDIIPLGPAGRPVTFDLDPSGRFVFAVGQTPLVFILKLPERP
jgi:WD40 repeat protein